MKNITKKWFEFAKKDLLNAKILLKNKSYEGCIWHCHQALEKYLKGVIVESGKSVRKTHDLPTLLHDTRLKFSKDVLTFIQELNAYYQPSRYPDTALVNKLSYSRGTANKFLRLTGITIRWLEIQLKQKK